MSIGETIDTSVDMQLGCITGDDLLLHGNEIEGLVFHSASDDEDFVIVDCKAAPQRSLSEPVTPNTASILPDTSRTLSEISRPSREKSPTQDNSFVNEIDDWSSI